MYVGVLIHVICVNVICVVLFVDCYLWIVICVCTIFLDIVLARYAHHLSLPCGGSKPEPDIKQHCRQIRRLLLEAGIENIYLCAKQESLDKIDERFVHHYLTLYQKEKKNKKKDNKKKSTTVMGPSTIRNYLSSLIQVAEYIFMKNMHPGELTASDLERFKAYRRIWNKVLKGKINQHAVSKFEKDQARMTTPADWQGYMSSPIAKWCTAILNGELKVPLTNLRVNDMICLRDHLILTLAFNNAARPSGLVGLKKDLYRNAVLWEENDTYTVPIPEHKTSKTKHAAYLCLSKKLKKEMDKFLAMWEAHLAYRGIFPDNDDFFQSKNGEPMRANNLCHAITNMMQYSGNLDDPDKPFNCTNIRKMSTTTVRMLNVVWNLW